MPVSCGGVEDEARAMTTTIKTAQSFYDSAASSGLSDYVHGNRRLEGAIKHTLQWLPKDSLRILDIGCGIGWSSWEIKRRRPDAVVLGIDLSPKRIEMATTLFSTGGLDFQCSNVLESAEIAGRFDAL